MKDIDIQNTWNLNYEVERITEIEFFIFYLGNIEYNKNQCDLDTTSTCATDNNHSGRGRRTGPKCNTNINERSDAAELPWGPSSLEFN